MLWPWAASGEGKRVISRALGNVRHVELLKRRRLAWCCDGKLCSGEQLYWRRKRRRRKDTNSHESISTHVCKQSGTLARALECSGAVQRASEHTNDCCMGIYMGQRVIPRVRPIETAASSGRSWAPRWSFTSRTTPSAIDLAHAHLHPHHGQDTRRRPRSGSAALGPRLPQHIALLPLLHRRVRMPTSSAS